MWKLAFRNLFRNLRRTLATGSAILSGFVGLSLLGGYILRTQNTLKTNSIYINHHGHLSIYKKDSVDQFFSKPKYYQITNDEKIKIFELLKKHKNHIEFTGEYISGVGLLSNGQKSIPFIGMGVDPDAESKIHRHPQVLKWAQDYLLEGQTHIGETLKEHPATISITRRLAELIGRSAPLSTLSTDQKTLQLAGRTYHNDINALDVDFKFHHTTGIDFLEDSSLWTSLKTLQSLYDTEGLQSLSLYLHGETMMEEIKSSLEQDFHSLNLSLEIFPFDSDIISPNYVGVMGFLYTMAGFFVFLICGTVALSIVNSLTMGIVERTKEIGTMRAVGFTQSDITFLFVKESFLLTLLCILIGFFFSYIITFIINHSDVMFLPPGAPKELHFTLVPSLPWMLLVAVTLCIVASLSGYFATKFKMSSTIANLLTD